MHYIWSPRRRNCTVPEGAGAPREAFEPWRSARFSEPATRLNFHSFQVKIWTKEVVFENLDWWISWLWLKKEERQHGDLEPAHILTLVCHSQKQFLNLGVVQIMDYTHDKASQKWSYIGAPWNDSALVPWWCSRSVDHHQKELQLGQPEFTFSTQE